MVKPTSIKLRLVGLFLILLGGWLVGWPTVTAQEPGPIVIISQVNDKIFPMVTARVTVIDKSGLAIQNLGPTDFLVWEDAQAVPQVAVQPVPPDQAEPINLVLALDVSGSMKEPDQNGILKIDAARAEAKSLLNSLGPDDQVAIISFSEEVKIAQPFTTDRAALQAAVDGLQLDGDTALNNALFSAAELTGNLPPGKKAIILLTDGLNTYGNLTLDDALDRARRSGVPVYTVGFFTGDIDSNMRNEAEKALTRIATVTNGRYFAAPTAEQLGATFQTLAQLLRLQYELNFQSGLMADCKTHELKVRVKYRGQDGDDFDVLTACPPNPAVVNLVGPADGENVSKLITFKPQIEPPFQLVSAEYQVDGSTMATLTAPPYSFEWETTKILSGTHHLVVAVTDSAGKVHKLERQLNVVSPLSLQILSPTAGKEVSGQLDTQVEITGPGQVAKVEFFWDKELLTTINTPPYNYKIDTKQYLDGEHTLLVRAYEVDGYTTEQSAPVMVRAVTSNAGLWLALLLVVLALALVIPLAMRARRRVAGGATVRREGGATPGGPVITGPSAWLEVIQGPVVGQRFTLMAAETTLGRSRTENDIHTPGRTASRQQGTIKMTNGQFVYYDLNPTNPTIINDQEIAGSHELYEGDRLEIGDMIFRFTLKEE